jgi:DHA1 family tetracycline resistance protein-like MFS transporter
MIAGLALSTVGFAALALAPTPLAFCLAAVPACLGNLCGPPLQALRANTVPPTEQGRLQGAMGGLNALAGLVGPIAFTQLYAWTLAQPGATGGEAMLAGSALLAAATLIGATVRRKPA